MRGARSTRAPSAVVVSNHGGRQLDGVHATMRVLPEVVAAVGGQIEVLLDGGIRRGSDIVKALCLGARAVLIGRAYAYGLGAAGGAGVARAIEILRADLIRTIKLLGCPSTTALDASYVDVPSDWLVDRPGSRPPQTGDTEWSFESGANGTIQRCPLPEIAVPARASSTPPARRLSVPRASVVPAISPIVVNAAQDRNLIDPDAAWPA